MVPLDIDPANNGNPENGPLGPVACATQDDYEKLWSLLR